MKLTFVGGWEGMSGCLLVTDGVADASPMNLSGKTRRKRTVGNRAYSAFAMSSRKERNGLDYYENEPGHFESGTLYIA